METREEKEKLRNIILLSFPKNITDELFTELENLTQNDTIKNIWKKGIELT